MQSGDARAGGARAVTPDELDGRIGEGWGGTSPNGSHVNVVLARRGSPTSPPRSRCSPTRRPGTRPSSSASGRRQAEYEPVWPPTLMMNKATATDERHQTMTWGAAQLGIGQGVLDAVADGLLEATGDLIVLVAVWVDAAADDETAVRRRTGQRRGRRSACASRDAIRTRRPRSSSGATRCATRSTPASEDRLAGDAALPLPARATVRRRLGPRAAALPGRDRRDRPLGRRRRGLRERRRRARPRAAPAAARRPRCRPTPRPSTASSRPSTSTTGATGSPRSRSGISSGAHANEPLWRLLGGTSERIARLRVERRARDAEERVRRCRSPCGKLVCAPPSSGFTRPTGAATCR